ncbi:MAG TPA: PDZ domain-containing protein [Steroidobacteraceae bacterium]|nr:PDZ domain-containing protein [Steroidobacteraceae bacterium]
MLRTLPGSPAERAELKGLDSMTGSLGDVIVAVNGAKIGSGEDLADALEKAGIGGSLDLAVEHGGTKRTVRVNVAESRSPA